MLGRSSESIEFRLSGQVRGSKKKRGQSYSDASELPLSPESKKDFAASAGKD